MDPAIQTILRSDEGFSDMPNVAALVGSVRQIQSLELGFSPPFIGWAFFMGVL
jgi:hypothetical protein